MACKQHDGERDKDYRNQGELYPASSLCGPSWHGKHAIEQLAAR